MHGGESRRLEESLLRRSDLNESRRDERRKPTTRSSDFQVDLEPPPRQDAATPPTARATPGDRSTWRAGPRRAGARRPDVHGARPLQRSPRRNSTCSVIPTRGPPKDLGFAPTRLLVPPTAGPLAPLLLPRFRLDSRFVSQASPYDELVSEHELITTLIPEIAVTPSPSSLFFSGSSDSLPVALPNFYAFAFNCLRGCGDRLPHP